MKAKITGKQKVIHALRDFFISKKATIGQVQLFNFSKTKNYLHQAPVTSLKCNMMIALAIVGLIFTNQGLAQQDNDFLFKKNQFRVGIGATYLKTVDFQYSPNPISILEDKRATGLYQ